MQNVSDLFKDIWADYGKAGFQTQSRVTIAGEVYEAGDLLSLRTYGGLFQNVSIGNVVSRQIDLQIMPKGAIPRQAEMRVEVRVTKDAGQKHETVRVLKIGKNNARPMGPGTFTIFVAEDAEQMYKPDYEITLTKSYGANSLITVKVLEKTEAFAYVEKWDEASQTHLPPEEISIEKTTSTMIGDGFFNTSTVSYTEKGEKVSEWIPKGVYYIKTRETNTITGVMTIHGFDAMLKSGQKWQDASVTASFPMTAADALADICNKMGVELEPGTYVSSAFSVKDFVDELGYMTMRSVLGRIAVANAGNWVMSDAWNTATGKPYMRLVPLVNTSGETVELGTKAENVYPGQAALPITRVVLLDSSGKIVGQAGEAADAVTGRVLTAENPEGTNEMAAFILYKVQGFAYVPYSAENALLTPAAELGDLVTVGGVQSMIAQDTIYFDDLYSADIAAPTTDEIEDEYPYDTEMERIVQAIAGTRSEITKTNEQIALKISSSEAESLIKQEVGKITLSVSSGAGGSSFVMTYNGVAISTQTLDLHVDAVNVDGDITARNVMGEVVALLTSAGTRAGEIKITDAETADYAIDLSSDAALRLSAASGNAYMEGSSGAYVNLAGETAPECRLGGKLVLNSWSYGTATPTTGTAGVVYFKKRV